MHRLCVVCSLLIRIGKYIVFDETYGFSWSYIFNCFFLFFLSSDELLFPCILAHQGSSLEKLSWDHQITGWASACSKVARYLLSFRRWVGLNVCVQHVFFCKSTYKDVTVVTVWTFLCSVDEVPRSSSIPDLGDSCKGVQRRPSSIRYPSGTVVSVDGYHTLLWHESRTERGKPGVWWVEIGDCLAWMMILLRPAAENCDGLKSNSIWIMKTSPSLGLNRDMTSISSSSPPYRDALRYFQVPMSEPWQGSAGIDAWPRGLLWTTRQRHRWVDLETLKMFWRGSLAWMMSLLRPAAELYDAYDYNSKLLWPVKHKSVFVMLLKSLVSSVACR
jgi:hypothetical protein